VKKLFSSPLILKSGIVTVDQAILSAVNFFISIVLIKNVPIAEFGYYSIAVPVLLFLISIQNAVINAPLSVLLVTKKGPDRQRYAASLCFGQFIAILPFACFGLIICAALFNFNILRSTQSAIAATLCVAAVGVLFREFLRSYFFAEESPLQALKLDALYAICFSSLIILTLFMSQIDVAAIFILMGISAFLFSLLFSYNLGWRLQRDAIKDSYRENWEFGKWALLGVIVTHIQKHSYLYMLAALLGSVAVAEVSAARLFLMPIMLAQIGWSKITIPYGSRLREENRVASYFKLQVAASLIFTVGLSLYMVALTALSGFLQSFLLTGKYKESLGYLLIWGAIFIIGSIRQNASCGLLVLKKFDIVSKIDTVTMLVTVVCAFLFIKTYGIMGGFSALIIGETLSAVILWFYFGKIIFGGRCSGIEVKPRLIEFEE